MTGAAARGGARRRAARRRGSARRWPATSRRTSARSGRLMLRRQRALLSIAQRQVAGRSGHVQRGGRARSAPRATVAAWARQSHSARTDGPGARGERAQCSGLQAVSRSVAPAGKQRQPIRLMQAIARGFGEHVALARGERRHQQAGAGDVEQRVRQAAPVGGSTPRAWAVGHGCSGTNTTACSASASGTRDLHTRPLVATVATRTPPSRQGTTLSGWPSRRAARRSRSPRRPADRPGSGWRSARRRRSRRRCCRGRGRTGCDWCSCSSKPG